MRLVDSDALMKSFENVLGAAPCELNGYEIWEVLNAQERIDAIPVEWIFEQMQILHELHNKNEYVLQWLIEMWQKEQEAQDG